ncbi:MAG: T9SS type A sorting domain-containing protein [Paludibacter sp.]|nr:T9SS type A sorting domain-containing protein [Paludibacter sp.]
MRRITFLLVIAFIALHSSIAYSQTVDATTAWFNGENFTSSTLGSPITYATGYDWSGTIPVIHTNTKTNVTTAGNILGFTTNVAADLTEGTNVSINTTKLFPTTLSGVVYAKMSSYHCTRGTGIVFKNTAGNTVFGFGSKDNNNGSNSNLRYTLDGFIAGGTSNGFLNGNPTLVEFTSAGFLRGQWYDWEMVIDLNAKKLLKLKATKTGGGNVSISNISLTNGGSLDKLNIVTAGFAAAAGFDNITIGELAPDKIANLTGLAEIQTLSSSVSKTYSLTATADIASLALTNIVVPGGDIVWTISDWGGLQAGDQALVTLTRNSSNHAEATLLTTNSVSADATITIQAQLGSGTILTKQVTLKAATLAGFKTLLINEIGVATNLRNSLTDSNPYTATPKSTITTAINSAQDKYDNSSSMTEVLTEIDLLKSAEANFSTAINPYNNYVSYIGTVTTGRDSVGTSYPSAAFFPAIKATLNTAVGIATAARDTISVAGGITNAQAALTASYSQFNTDKSTYYALGTQIATSQARYAIVNLRKGDAKFLQFPTLNVDNLGAAITTAQSTQNTATTATEISTATSTLGTALTTFNGLARVVPSTNYYRIYTYGTDGGDGGANKNILFAHTNRSTLAVTLNYTPMQNATSLALGDSALWTITAGSTNSSYIIQNKATGQYLSGIGFSATSAEFTLPEAKSQSSNIQYPGDPNYLYAIVNSSVKALEVDLWTSPLGVFVNNSGYADRYRFAYQFEELQTPAISTVESTVNTFTTTVGTPVNKTLSLSGTNLFGTMTLGITGTNAGLFSVSPATYETANSFINNSTVTITYTPAALTTTNDVATLSIGIAGGNTLTYNLEGQATLATDLISPENTMKVYSVQNRLIVTGVNSYEVYNLQGIKIYNIRNNNANTSMVLNKGVYFVKSTDNVQKVIIK